MQSKNAKKNMSGGLGLIEGVVAVAIVGSAFVAVVGAFNLFLRTALRTTPEIKAIFLLDEGLEAMRSIRDIDWQTEISPLALDTPHNLVFVAGRWESTTTPITYIDGVYDRTVVLASVNRDSDGRVVASGGTLDPNTKYVTVSVAWSNRTATTTKTASLYITNLFTE